VLPAFLVKASILCSITDLFYHKNAACQGHAAIFQRAKKAPHMQRFFLSQE
jgi:hypothetical protein